MTTASEIPYETSITIYFNHPHRPQEEVGISFGSPPLIVALRVKASAWRRLLSRMRRFQWPKDGFVAASIDIETGHLSRTPFEPAGRLTRSQKREVAKRVLGRITAGAVEFSIDRNFFASFRSVCLKAERDYARHRVIKWNGREQQVRTLGGIQMVFEGRPCMLAFQDPIPSAPYCPDRRCFIRDIRMPKPKGGG